MSRREENAVIKNYRTQFNISPSDLDVIEHALRDQVRQLLKEKLRTSASDRKDNDVATDTPDLRVRDIQGLLGKLHDQKIWYTPPHFIPRG